MDIEDHIRGALFGAAIGDALGRPTEFLNVKEITKKYGRYGPDLPTPAYVTDDTQMMLAVGRAVTSVETHHPASVGPALRRELVRWYRDPKTNDGLRAPGSTCLAACRGLAQGLPWRLATRWQSKGCGANMRVQPVGLMPLTTHQRDELAELQAVLTHGHPTALMASRLTAYVVQRCLEGHTWSAILDGTREAMYPALHYTPPLGVRAYVSSEARRACREVLAPLRQTGTGWQDDPCVLTGDGWNAETALATALHTCQRFPDDPEMALRRAAVTRGDSDSIACLTGSFMGARYGVKALPEPWVERIEYREELEELALKLAALWG